MATEKPILPVIDETGIPRLTKVQWDAFSETDAAIKAADDLLAEPDLEGAGALQDALREVRAAAVVKIEGIFDECEAAAG